MAKQGNYVTLPGGGVNWTKDISDSLSGLSDSYRKQADTKAARELAAAAEQEDKRRFQLGIERQDARYGVEDKRHEADQIRQSIAEVEAKRRWESDAAMRQATHKAQMDEIARIKAKEDALMYADRRAANGDFREHKFDLAAQTPEMREVYNSVLGRLDKTKAALGNVLTPDKKDWTIKDGGYDSVMEDYRTLMKNSDLSEDKQNENIAAFGKDILGLMHEKTIERQKDGGMTAEDWQLRANKVIDDRFNPMINNVNEAIAEGQGLDRDSALSAIMRTLPEKVRNNLLYSDLDKLLGNRFNFNTKEQIRATEQARVDNLNAAEKVIYDRNLDKLKLIKDAGTSSGSGSNKTAKGMLNTFKALNVEGTTEDGIGSWDMDDVNNGVNYLMDKYKDKGLDPDAIAAVFIGGVESKWLGLDDDFPEVGTEAFAKLEQRVKDLSGKYSGGGNASFNKALKDSESLFGYKPKTARSLLDVQKDSIKIRGDNNYRLGVDSKYDFVAQEAKAKAAAKAAKAKEDAKAVTEPPKHTKEELDAELPERKLLDKDTERNLDMGETGTFGPRSAWIYGSPSKDYTPRQELSQQIKETLEKIDRLEARSKGSPNGPTGDRARREKEKQLLLLKGLEGRLRSLK